MTSIQLKELMKKRGIPRRSLATKKREMINLLEKDDRSLAAAFTEQPPAQVTAQRAEPESEHEQDKLQEQIESKIQEICSADAKNLLQDLLMGTQDENLLIDIEKALYRDLDLLFEINQWLVQPDECSHEDRLKHLVRFTTLSIAPRGLVINPAIPLTEPAPAIVPTLTTGQAISIQQPWAWAIFHLGKNVENRTWPTDIRGRVFIHASRRYNWGGAVWIEKNFGIAPPSEKELPKGAIIGSVEITDCIKNSASTWAMQKQFHFLLNRPVSLDAPIPMRGQLKFFQTNLLLPRNSFKPTNPANPPEVSTICPCCLGTGCSNPDVLPTYTGTQKYPSNFNCQLCEGDGYLSQKEVAYFMQMTKGLEVLPGISSEHRIIKPAPSHVNITSLYSTELQTFHRISKYLNGLNIDNLVLGPYPFPLQLLNQFAWEAHGFVRSHYDSGWFLVCPKKEGEWVVFHWQRSACKEWHLSVSRLSPERRCACESWRRDGECMHRRAVKTFEFNQQQKKAGTESKQESKFSSAR